MLFGPLMAERSKPAGHCIHQEVSRMLSVGKESKKERSADTIGDWIS